jgi:hypothetical protein
MKNKYLNNKNLNKKYARYAGQEKDKREKKRER